MKFSSINSDVIRNDKNVVLMFKAFLDNLVNISHHIIILNNFPHLRLESLKLMAFLNSKYYNRKYENDLEQLLELPATVTNWPNTKSEIFFSICTLQLETIG